MRPFGTRPFRAGTGVRRGRILTLHLAPGVILDKSFSLQEPGVNMKGFG